tara:strand:- start:631 stop:2277 length:1647 start_codon:yes stop_codon:yes gene_type:complete
MSELNYLNSKKYIILYLVLILTFGLGLRFYYFPYDVPIVTDGFFSFVYAVKTVFDSSLPVGYTTTNTGWSNFLSLFFVFSDTSDPLHLMNTQRTLSIILSTITIIPAFFIFRRFVDTRWALFGSFLLAVEPRLLIMSLEGINYSLFFFLFVLTITFFLKKTNFWLFLSFVCIACSTLVRSEGLLLVIPLSIMYFIRFRDKKSILRFLGMIFVFAIIILSVGILRIQATESICNESFFGMTCGQDGFSSHFFGGLSLLQKYIISDEQILDDRYIGDDFLRETYNKPDENYAVQAANESFSRLAKFLGLALIPYFGFFMLFNVISRIKNWKNFDLNFDSKVILSCIGIILLPALFAYLRGIDEIRYVLVALPLFCIISVSWNKSISEKISKNWGVIIILMVLVLTSSIIFIEFEKRDSIHDRESFLVSQKIIELTNITNSFHQDGYIKTSVLISSWPVLPEAGQNGKLIHVFQKMSTNNYHDLAEFVIDSKKSDLRYLVIDKDNKLFDVLRKNPAGYPYLNKIFDSNDFDFENHFMIYEINYKLFDNNDK